MNERIRQLAEQFKISFSADGYAQEGIHWDNVDEFAQLIVQECLKLNKGQLVVIPEKQEDWDGHNYGMTAAVYGFEELVKEHFGVEQ